MFIRKILAVAVILLFIGTSISSTGTIVEKKVTMPINYDGNTLYVGGSGGGNYSKIQDAINDSSNGDTVFVFDDSSPYYENVVVDKSINLIGEDMDTTVIDGNMSGDVVYAPADWVNISGFTIQNSRISYYYAGIHISSNYNTITGNIISDNDDGIYLWGSSDYNTIAGNIISSNNWNGISLYKSNSNTITGNNIISNNVYGISLYKSNSNTITGNNISDNRVGIKPYESNSTTITGNNISDNMVGISLYGSNNNITNNNISSNNWEGISLYGSNNNITNNIISNNGFGMYLCDSSDYNIITDNIISNSRYEGIYFSGSSNNITGNIISNNEYGINLYKSNSNTITGNNIISNNDYGIKLASYCFINIISGNNISNNDDGIILYESNNTIYHNNFINNTQNAYDECDNTWYNATLQEGNYWDDYNGIDNDGDGIGDTPYKIQGGDNQDRYPLMEPFDQYPQFDVSGRGGIGLKISITNVGDIAATNVKWSVSVKGGLLDLINLSEDGSLNSLDIGESISLTLMPLGFGVLKISIEIDASYAEKQTFEGRFFVILFIVFPTIPPLYWFRR